MTIRFSYLLFCAALLCVGNFHYAHAQERSSEVSQRYEGWMISKVHFRGLKRIEPDAITAKILTKQGNILSSREVRSDIQTIFRMGYFDDIDVKVNPGAQKKLEVIFELKERPVIAELFIEGNEKISSDDLREVVRLKEWAILDINLVRRDTELIQKHYEEKGFYLAKVSYGIERMKDDEVRLIYKVSDYDKVEIKKITFLNNKVFSDRILKNAMPGTQEGGFFSFLSGSGSFKESTFKDDLQRLTFWYLDHGYIKFRYENPIVTVSEDKKWLYITIYVEEGQKYQMGEVDFSGDLLFSTEEMKNELKLLKDEDFRISLRNQDIQTLTEKYQDLGYAFVNVIPKMEFHDEEKKIDIQYHFEKGNLVYFGKINILGNTKTHDKVIRRELRVYEGKLYSGSGLRISRERVERLGYFQPGEVIFNTKTRKGRDDIVDLDIIIKERSTGTITLGAGYGSVQKFFLTTQIREINLFGRGQTLSLEGQYAADRLSKSLNLGFTDPYAFDTNWSMGFDIFSIHFPIPNKYLMRKLGFDIRFGYPLADDVNAFITYKNESLTITRKEDTTIDTSLDEGVLSSVVWSVVRDKRNNRFETTGGNYQSASLETAGLGGDKKFIKWSLNNRLYFRLIGDLVFRNSTEYGQITQAGGRGIPPSEKFYLGGPNNMKGYQIFSLGPRRVNSNGFYEPLGGNVQIFSLFEMEYPLIREAGLKWVFFFDAGNAFDRFPGTGGEAFKLQTDAGFGLRWFSPIGPLRFEWGFPLNPRDGDGSPVFQFFIGPPF